MYPSILGPTRARHAQRLPSVPPTLVHMSPKHIVRHARRCFAARRPRHLIGPVAVVLSALVLCLPSAYSVERPGPTRDVLGKDGDESIISLTGAATHRDKGQLRLTTVNASGIPGAPVTNAEVLWAWVDPHSVVQPREAVVPIGQTAEEYQKESEKDMTDSQKSAADAALALLKARGKDVNGIEASMHIDDIGGPSAGMMYALGVIDKLTPEEETGGKVIAGTGTMNADGKVGEIGGIRLKMLGAKRDGATWFLAPAGNCDEVAGHVPDGLRDVRVSTLSEAYDALVAIGRGKGDDLPHCTAR